MQAVEVFVQSQSDLLAWDSASSSLRLQQRGLWDWHATGLRWPTYEAAILGAGLYFLEAAVSSETPAAHSYHGPVRSVPRMALWTTGVGLGDAWPGSSADVMPLVDTSAGFRLGYTETDFSADEFGRRDQDCYGSCNS